MSGDWVGRLREAVRYGRVEWKMHALERMLERGIGRREVLATLEAGEVIERYPERRPFPAVLLLGGLRRPLHVVAAYDAGEDRCHVVTAYRPSAERFHEDWKTRR